jgi:hypothetical protein
VFDEVVGSDPRPPILYLRSFRDERAIFAELDRPPAGRVVQFMRRRLADQHEHYLTLDRYLKAEVESLLGPLVALGSPRDRLPDFGATRSYVDGGADRGASHEREAWRDEVRDLMDVACVILVRPGVTCALEWEMRQVRAQHLEHKLMVVTSPYGAGRKEPLGIRVANGLRPGCAPVRWDDFGALMQRAGFRLPTAGPPAGTVLAFDSSGQAHVVGTNLTTAHEYATALASRVAGN